MERFEGARMVQLKGPHGKFLWAEEDQYTVSQHHEDKNEMAVWRVERVNSGNGKRATVLRFKSCFDTYLTAMDIHHHDVSFLAFSGRKVAQMRPENVESQSGFDWEPVIEHGMLMLKSCFGTWLRANRHAPPWNDTVSHDLPRHSKHEDWLTWEVQSVSAPNVIPLEDQSKESSSSRYMISNSSRSPRMDSLAEIKAVTLTPKLSQDATVTEVCIPQDTTVTEAATHSGACPSLKYAYPKTPPSLKLQRILELAHR